MRPARLLAPACALALLVLNPAMPFGMQAARRAQAFCRIVLDPTNKFTRVVAPERDQPGARVAAVNTATITVNYTGFTAQAQAAFQAAVDIWQTQVGSSIPIVVNAQYKDLGNGSLLGQAGPNGVLANFNASARSNTWYPIPIVNKISLFDFNAAAQEINAEFNSTRADWYFGTDGNTPANTIDFVTVVLHELGHGLGFLGAGNVAGGQGTVRETGVGQNPPRYPYVYDAYVVDGQGHNLADQLFYPDNSVPLATALQSGNLFWNGPAGSNAAGPQPPRLYAPTTWTPQSSYSHLDETAYPAGSINSLMTPSIGFSEANHVPGPIMLGMFQDMGWVSSSCSYVLSVAGASAPVGGTTSSVNVTAQAGCVWTAASNAPFVSITAGSTGNGNGIVTYSVDASTNVSQRVGTLTIAGQTFTITQAGTGPTLSLDRAVLQFAAINSGSSFVQKTTSQTVRISQSGTGTVTWQATPSHPWITVSPTSGTGAATLTIGVAFSNTLPLSGTTSGTVALSFTGAGNNAGPVSVGLTTVANGASAPPFGAIDTPADNATGVTGSIPVTGWALDDIEVRQVQIWRDPVAGEGTAQIFIGNAVLVDGARPDVVALNPTRPRNTQAGWGYLMLTNFLPSQGNGTFRITAIATDAENKTTVLGARTITCTNNSAILPFGAIDTPGQGEVVSGSNYTNFGWVLAHEPARADPPDGGTVTAYVDGVSIGSPGGWVSRPDLTSSFPPATYPAVVRALGVIGFDTTTLANGVHTIFWIVTGTNGQQDGIGSRFFTVSNSSAGVPPSQSFGETRRSLGGGGQAGQGAASLRLTAPALLSPVGAGLRGASLRDVVNAAPLDRTGILARRGFDRNAPMQSFPVDAGGRATIHSEEMDRIELQLKPADRYTGYMRVGADIGPLPIGSHLDQGTGVFTWAPGVGFVHDYDLVFLRCVGSAPAACFRQEARIVLQPKQSNRVGPQVVIDLPGSVQKDSIAQPFVVAGWAIDPDAPSSTGIDTLHVWAYPAGGGDPIFVGVTAYGGSRPDVAAIFGDRFRTSGYALTVDSLPPGTYDLAVFAWSTATGGFVPAKTVRVTVR